MPARETSSGIKAVVMDYDGPIVHSAPHIYAFQTLVCQKKGFKSPLRDFNHWCELVFDPFQKFYEFLGFDWERDHQWIDSEFKSYMAEVDIQVHKGIIQMWERLKKRGLFVAIASSNLEEVIRQKLRSNNADHLVDAIAGYGNGCRAKPAPDSLIACAKKIPMALSSCLYVGDMLTDRAAAESAGMQFVPVSWGNKDETAWKRLYTGFIPKNVDELEEYIWSLTSPD